MYENARLQKVIDIFVKVTEPLWVKGPDGSSCISFKITDNLWKDEDEIAFNILKPYAKKREY